MCLSISPPVPALRTLGQIHITTQVNVHLPQSTFSLSLQNMLLGKARIN